MKTIAPILFSTAALTAALFAAETPAPANAADAFARLDQRLQGELRPLMEKFCFNCHNAEKHKGDLDLDLFRAIGDVRKDTRTWEKTLEQMATGEMPPKEKKQPEAAERERMIQWIKDFLNVEAHATAGDPGRVLMRRLNNIEFTLTIRDLTGAALDPAREFPAEGAAGEGFVNVGDALAMSPSLLEKYLAAAKDLAAHAVLLPEGLRFSPSTRRGDWTEEVIGQIRQLYARHTDATGGTAIDLQGIKFDTNTGGRLPLAQYLTATLEDRAALQSGGLSIADAAKKRRLNPRYLRRLWDALTNPQPSVLLARVRQLWLDAAPQDAPRIAAEIESWQKVLTKFQTVGHVKPWMVPVDPLAARQDVRIKMPDKSTGGDSKLFLAAADAGDGSEGDFLVLERPRFTTPGRREILLKDVRTLAHRLQERRQRLFAAAGSSLNAAAEAASAPGAVDRPALARKHGVDPDILDAWLDFLGVAGGAALKLDYFTQKLAPNPQYNFVSGWGVPETPSIVANSSDQHVRIPGNLNGHSVAVHPSPTLQAAVGWLCAERRGAKIEARITHAHPECGNGVVWSLELRRGGSLQKLAAGVAQGGNPVKAGPFERSDLQKGDFISLLVGPRDGNHSCDLTDVELTITQLGEGGRQWSLARDVSGNILAANPHADSFGADAAWHFYTEPVAAGKLAGEPVPPGSALAKWQEAATAEEKSRWAQAVQNILTSDSPPADKSSPDAQLRQQLASLGGALLSTAREKLSAEAATAEAAADSPWGLDPSRFGRHPDGSEIDAASLCLRAPAVLEVSLPSDLIAGCEFVAAASLHSRSGADGSVQFLASLEKPSAAGGLQPGAAQQQRGAGPWGSDTSALVHDMPLLTAEGSAARRRFAGAFNDFRDLFPAALCYPKIIPVDEVITLTVFHREDENLCRLMLDDGEKRQLDRLWEELRFIGQDALTMVDAYEQLWQYATQDSNPKLFEHLKQPILDRAAAFRKLLTDSEPKQLEAVVEFAARAYRRPLGALDKEELRGLYRQLRSEEMAHEEALRLTLAKVFLSPAFLYRVEQPSAGDKARQVSDWELASRLSYFLWSSMPDASLTSRAAKSELGNPDNMAAEARRMLGDGKVRALATEFACQWLHLRDFDSLNEKSDRLFPEFSGLRSAMYEEVIRFFIDLFQRDGSVLDIIDADYTFLNEPLAKHYGIPGVSGPEWRKVDGIKKHGRGGMLGMAALLSKQAGASRTSPILRGNWLVEVLLGDKLPKPPKGVPPLPESEADAAQTMRQITEKHSSDPKCSGCHVRIDPFGYALEAYDAIGRLREKDLGGRPIDTFVELPTRQKIQGATGLREYLLTVRKEDFLRTFCRKLLGYALGRGLKLSDNPLVEDMVRELLAHECRFSVALEKVLRSPQFLNQRGLEATKEEAH